MNTKIINNKETCKNIVVAMYNLINEFEYYHKKGNQKEWKQALRRLKTHKELFLMVCNKELEPRDRVKMYEYAVNACLVVLRHEELRYCKNKIVIRIVHKFCARLQKMISESMIKGRE